MKQVSIEAARLAAQRAIHNARLPACSKNDERKTIIAREVARALDALEAQHGGRSLERA